MIENAPLSAVVFSIAIEEKFSMADAFSARQTIANISKAITAKLSDKSTNIRFDLSQRHTLSKRHDIKGLRKIADAVGISLTLIYCTVSHGDSHQSV